MTKQLHPADAEHCTNFLDAKLCEKRVWADFILGFDDVDPADHGVVITPQVVQCVCSYSPMKLLSLLHAASHSSHMLRTPILGAFQWQI